MADKQIRTVTLDEREQGRRRGSLWAYGVVRLRCADFVRAEVPIAEVVSAFSHRPRRA